MSKITVIGSMAMDNVAIMDRFASDGETVLGNSIGVFPGGKGGNQCVSIARLGGDVEMIGMLGNDENGRNYLKILNEEGIKTDNVFICDKPTGIALIEINANGQNRICVIPSANYVFSFEEVEKIDSVLKETEIVVLQMELKIEIVEEIIKRAYNYGVKVLLNPAPAVKLSNSILEKIDYITPNETELSVLMDMPTDTETEIELAAKKMLGTGVKNVIVTLGDKGALLVNNDVCKVIKGFKAKAVDTVAAGDSFNGALVVSLIEGKSLEEAIIFANAMGALTVQVKGAIPSLHRRKEVEKFLNEQKLKK